MSTSISYLTYGPEGRTFGYNTNDQFGSFQFQLLGANVDQYGPELEFVFAPGSIEVIRPSTMNKTMYVYATDGVVDDQSYGSFTNVTGTWLDGTKATSASLTSGWWTADSSVHYIAFTGNPNNIGGPGFDAWMRVSLNSNNTLTIYDWAYTNQPETAIMIGEMPGNCPPPPIIPEPSSILLVAVFWIFLLFRRTRNSVYGWQMSRAKFLSKV